MLKNLNARQFNLDMATEDQEEVSPYELRKWLAQKRPLLLLDVRIREEFAKAHIEGAKSMPLSHLYPNFVEDLRQYPGEPIILVCEKGIRSSYAYKLLKTAGVKKIFFVRGGLVGCRKAGIEFVGTKPPEQASFSVANLFLVFILIIIFYLVFCSVFFR